MQSLPSRHVVAAEAESLAASALRRITPGHFLVTEDGSALAAQIASLLMDRGCTSTLIAGDVLASEERLAAWIAGPGCRNRGARRRHPSGRGRRRPGSPPTRPWPPGAGSSCATRSRCSSCCATSPRGWPTTPTCCRSARSAARFGRGAGAPRGLSLQGGARRPAQVAARGTADAARQGGRCRSGARRSPVSPAS